MEKKNIISPEIMFNTIYIYIYIFLGWAIYFFSPSLKNIKVRNAWLPGVHVKLIMKVWLLNGHTAAFHILLIHNGINTVYGQDTQSGALDKVPSENRAPNV